MKEKIHLPFFILVVGPIVFWNMHGMEKVIIQYLRVLTTSLKMDILNTEQ